MQNDWVGVWIDHRNAFVVRPTVKGCEVTSVLSELEQHHKSTGGKGKSQPFMHESGPSSASHRARSDENTMHNYLNRVAAKLNGANRIFLLGPGNAKDGLRSLLVQGEGGHQLVDIALEAAEQMTKPQLKAMVMKHFGHPARRYWRRAP
ncbi:MAG: hypothetical protein NTV34_03590, partial [Proteobacteria bacterium]|nr:hypothetical protein [Pseudomonadota bacterium]